MDKVRDHFLEDEKEAVESCLHPRRQELFGGRAERRAGICQAQGLGPAPAAGPEGQGRGRTRHGAVFPDPQRHGLRLSAAGGHRTGQRQRVRLPIAGPRRPGPRRPDGGPQPAARHGGPGSAADRGSAPTAWRMCPNTGSTWIGKRPAPWGFPSAPSTPPSRRPSAAPMSTTSSRAAGSSGSTSRPTPPTACCPRTWKSSMCATRRARWCPFPPLPPATGPTGSPQLERFNGFPSINIWGEPAPGRSSGEAMQAMEEIVAKLPQGIGFDWTGLSYQERMAGSQAPPALCLFHHRHFPLPGGPVRELADSHLDSADPAAGGHRRGDRLDACGDCPTMSISRSGC